MSLTIDHLTQSECEFCDLVEISRTLIVSWQIGSLNKLPIQMKVSLTPLDTRSNI